MQDLVAVGVPDARDHALVAQEALDLPPLPRQQRGERVPVEAVGQRIGAEAGDARHLLGVVDDVHGEALLGARLGEVEAAPALQDHAQGERPLAGPRRRGGEGVLPAQPAGPGQVGDEVESADPQVEELALAGGGPGRLPFEGGERRIVRLEHADGERKDTGDHPPGEVLVEELPEGLDLRQLGHVPSLTAPAAIRERDGMGQVRSGQIRS